MGRTYFCFGGFAAETKIYYLSILVAAGHGGLNIGIRVLISPGAYQGIWEGQVLARGWGRFCGVALGYRRTPLFSLPERSAGRPADHADADGPAVHKCEEAERRSHLGPLSSDEDGQQNDSDQEAAKENGQYEEANGPALPAGHRSENHAE